MVFKLRSISIKALVALVAILLAPCLSIADIWDFNGSIEGPDGIGRGLDFELQPGNRPALTYYTSSPYAVGYSEFNGTAWAHTTVDDTIGATPVVVVSDVLGVAARTSLVIRYGVPHIFYYDTNGSRLMHAYRSFGAWIKEVIDDSAGVGKWISAAQCGDMICISFYDEQNGNLRFGKGVPGLWSLETAHSSTDNVGVMSAIASDTDGLPTIIYYDFTNQKPRYAKKGFDNAWMTEAIEALAIPYGIWPDVRVASDGTVYFVSSRLKTYDTAESDMGFYLGVRSTGGTWSVSAPDQLGGSKGGHPTLILDDSDRPIAAYRYILRSAIFGHSASSMVGRLFDNGIWYRDNVGRYGFHYSYHYTLQKNPWGQPVLAFYFNDTGLSSYQIKGPEDQDGDGLPDLREAIYQGESADSDSDNDGLLDGFEALVTNTSLVNTDSDGDGINDGTDPDPVRFDPGNLISDGSMENLTTDHWSPYGMPLVLEKTSVDVLEGNRSLHIKSGEAIGGVERRAVLSNQSTRYYLSGRYKRVSGTVSLRLAWGDSGEDFSSGTWDDSASAGWQQVKAYVTTPAAAGDLRAILTTDGEVYLDDVYVVESPAGIDLDSDGINDDMDNCPLTANAGQEDLDNDGQGNACDSDRDGDTVLNITDCAPDDATRWRTQAYSDLDNDGVRDSANTQTLACFGSAPAGYTTNVSALDNCPNDANTDQADADNDTLGNACDSDDDADLTEDDEDCAPLDYSKYYLATVYPDSDSDTIPESNSPESSSIACTTSWGAPAGWTQTTSPLDNCPGTWNYDQTDSDGDGIGDECDPIDNSSSSSASSNSSSSSSSSASLDSDNDGLSDSDEENLGTDPHDADSDDDSVNDGQEVIDGTNPLDRGSAMPVVGTRTEEGTWFCAQWNGFFQGRMWNYFEHRNLANQRMTITTRLFDQGGTERSRYRFHLAPGAQTDIPVHALEGWQAQSYGMICSLAENATPGTVDGAMLYYFKDEEPEAQGNRFQFAFAMPITNGRTGTQYVPFNTYQPSLAAKDANKLPANWVSVYNGGTQKAKGTLDFYDMFGEPIASHQITLAPSARQDVSGHQFGLNNVGIVKWSPEDATIPFQLRNVRYLYDNTGNADRFMTGFQLEGSYGTGENTIAPLDTTGASSIIELTNIAQSENRIRIRIFSEGGSLRYDQLYKLGANETRHIIADDVEKLGPDSLGSVMIDGTENSGVTATVMQYARESDGSIKSMYGIPAKQALGTVLRGSYNTYIEQLSTLVLLNPTDQSVGVTVSMVRSDGVIVLTGQETQLPPNGVSEIALNQFTSENEYGVVTAQPDRPSSIVAWSLRKRGDDYVIPTPVRQ